MAFLILPSSPVLQNRYSKQVQQRGLPHTGSLVGWKPYFRGQQIKNI